MLRLKPLRLQFGRLSTNYIPRRWFKTSPMSRDGDFEITEEMLKGMLEKKTGKEEPQNNEASTKTPELPQKASVFVNSSNSLLSDFLQKNVSKPIEFTNLEEQDFFNDQDSKVQNDFDADFIAKLDDFSLLLDSSKDAKSKQPQDPVIILNTQRIYKDRNTRLAKKTVKKSNTSIRAESIFDLARHKKSALDSKTDIEQYVKAIESWRPQLDQLQLAQFAECSLRIAKLFSRPQLKLYIQRFPQHSSGISKLNKAQMAEHILGKVWGVRSVESVNNVKDLISEETVQLNARSLKLLLSDSGVVIFNWRTLGADILIDSHHRLTIKLTLNIISYIKVLMNNILDSTQFQSLDMSEHLDVLQDKKFLDFVSSLTDVVYEIDGNMLNLYSLKDHRLSEFRQLVLVKLYKSEHIVDEFVEPSYLQKTYKASVNDTVSIPEIESYKKWFRVQLDKERVAVEDEIFDDLLDYDTINDEIKELMLEQLTLEPVLEDIKQKSSEKRFQSNVKVFQGESEQEIEMDSVEEVGSGHGAVETDTDDMTTSILNQIDVDSAYGKLLPDDNRMITATLGSILMDETQQTKIFNSHLPFINDKIASLPLYLGSLAADKDNFDYVFVVKMIPNPYVNCDKSYPPVEFWFEPSGTFIDPKSLRILLTESETNIHYSIPDLKCDLKLSSSCVFDIDTNFNKTSQWLKDQPGVVKFLEDSDLSAGNFKGSNFKAACSLKIGKEEVEYLVVEAQLRRQLELKFKDRLLQYSIIDKGQYIGKQLEVNLVETAADGDGRISKAEFKEFVKLGVEFIKSL